MAQQPETLLQRRFQKRLKLIKGLHYVNIQQQSLRGHADFFMCAGGWSIHVELKKCEKLSPSKQQQLNLDKHERAGGYSLVGNPQNIEELTDFIREVVINKERLEIPKCLQSRRKL